MGLRISTAALLRGLTPFAAIEGGISTTIYWGNRRFIFGIEKMKNEDLIC